MWLIHILLLSSCVRVAFWIVFLFLTFLCTLPFFFLNFHVCLFFILVATVFFLFPFSVVPGTWPIHVIKIVYRILFLPRPDLRFWDDRHFSSLNLILSKGTVPNSVTLYEILWKQTSIIVIFLERVLSEIKAYGTKLRNNHHVWNYARYRVSNCERPEIFWPTSIHVIIMSSSQQLAAWLAPL